MSDTKKNSSFLQASALIAGSNYISYATGLVGSILIARVLGPADYGKYAYLIWIVGVFISLANNGLPVAAIKFISESTGSQNQNTAAAYLAKLNRLRAISLGTCVPAIGFYAYYETDPSWKLSSAFVAIYILISTIFKGEYIYKISIAKGLGHFTIESTTVFWASLANLGMIFIAWVIGVNIEVMLAINCLTSFLYWGISKKLLRNPTTVDHTRGLAPAELRRLKSYLGWTIILTAVGQLNETAVNLYALNRFSSPSEVGFYSVSANLTKAGIDLIVIGFSSVLMASLGHSLGRGGLTELSETYRKSVKNLHFLGLLVAGTGALLSEIVILTLYGQKFHPSIAIMQTMFLVGGLTLTDGVFTALLGTMDKQKERTFVTGLALITSGPASYLMAKYYGLPGAVMGYAIIRLTVYTVTAIFSTRISGIAVPWQQMLRMTALMIITLITPVFFIYFLPHPLTPVFAALLFLATFPLTCLHQKIWEPAEIAELSKLIARVPFGAKLLQLRLIQRLKPQG